MINPLHLKHDIIIPALDEMEPLFPGASHPTAVNTLCGIVSHESTVGGVTFLRQQGGPALGIYQIEPNTHIDLWNNYLLYREDRAKYLVGLMPEALRTNAGESDDGPVNRQLVGNLPYATAIARTILYRASFGGWPSPHDIEGQARIWKDHWNTHLGAGTVEQFIDAYPREIL